MNFPFFKVFLLLWMGGTCLAATPDLGARCPFTPYDPYFAPVKSVLNQLGSDHPAPAQVRHWMKQGRKFRYYYSDPYRARVPEETAQQKAGDCKDKALWLASRLNDASLRFVVGKAKESSRISHAWLLWEDKENARWYILDCTYQSAPIPVEKVSPQNYIPFYSFTQAGTYAHPAAFARM